MTGAEETPPGPSPALFLPLWVFCVTDTNVLRHLNPTPEPQSLLPGAPGICAGCEGSAGLRVAKILPKTCWVRPSKSSSQGGMSQQSIFNDR